MKIIETFEYEVPDGVEFPTVQDSVNMETCPFYDGMEFIPDIKRIKYEKVQRHC